MKSFSNFDLQAQSQYNVNEIVDKDKFASSGADEYFREYDYTKKYFSEDREILYGKSFPLEIRHGIPEDDETAEFYTFYTYAKQ